MVIFCGACGTRVQLVVSKNYNILWDLWDSGDKSPKSHMSEKAKSLKEKRADKHAKSAAKDHTEIITPKGKR